MRWHLDLIVSRGTWAVVAALVALVLVLVGVGAGLRQLIVSEGAGSSIWSALSRLLDVSSIQQDVPWDQRLASLGFVILGLACSALVIALVVTALQGSIDRVRNRSPPLRRTPDLVVLGWSDQVFTLLNEFAAFRSGRSTAVVSLHPRVWMDNQIAKECGDARQRLRIETRTADRTDPRPLTS